MFGVATGSSVGPLPDTGGRAPFALLLRVEVAVEEVTVQAVEEDDDEVRGPIRRLVRRLRSGVRPTLLRLGTLRVLDALHVELDRQQVANVERVHGHRTGARGPA